MEPVKKIRRKIFLIFSTVLFGLLFTNNAYAGTYGITSGRLESILAAVAGIISIVIGRSALRSINHNSSAKQKSMISLALGLICIIASGIHLVHSYSANFGTGSGKAGAIVALVLGVTGMVLGGLALSRSMRRNPKI
jgi:hypothetical protein